MQEHYYLPQRCLNTIGTLKYTDNTTIREAHITPINTTKTIYSTMDYCMAAT